MDKNMKHSLFKSFRRKGDETRWYAWGYPDVLLSDVILLVLLVLAITGHLSASDALVGALNVIKQFVDKK